jgi:twitching motility protein PilT
VTKRLQPDPDLEALIERLNRSARENGSPPEGGEPRDPEGDSSRAPAPARWALPPANDDAREPLEHLLSRARAALASDLLLVAGIRPVVRVHGRLAPLEGEVLTSAVTRLLCAALVPDTHRSRLESAGSVDFTWTRSGLGRFRCNVHRSDGHWCAAVRMLPEAVPDLADLHLPAALERFAELEHGLILVTGPTGSGKSTTLAAIVRRILARRTVHLVTIEDPVEYAHPHGSSVVEHIEVGRDAPSFAAALRSVLRQDPDVLLIGEMRDPESVSIAITAAETGHLVLSTLHTGDAAQTIHRVLDTYPSSQMEQVRAQLSVSIAAIVSQQLLPRRDGRGRVPAVEILVATHAVRNLIRQGKIAHIRAQLALERQAGMLDLDWSLASLVRGGLVDADMARARARLPGEFDQLFQR